MKSVMIVALAATAMAQSLSISNSINATGISAANEPSISGATVNNSTSTEGTTTITEYYSDCSTLPVTDVSVSSRYNSTTTATLTQTIPCQSGGDSCKTSNGVLTTYTTVYKEICPTGLADKTYTITEPCPETNKPRPTDHVPSGFTVTTAVCEPCKTKTITLTTPAPAPTPPPAPPAPPAPGPPAPGPPAPGPPAPAPPAPPVVTPVPVANATTSVPYHKPTTSIQFGAAAPAPVGFGVAGLFSFIAGAFFFL